MERKPGLICLSGLLLSIFSSGCRPLFNRGGVGTAVALRFASGIPGSAIAGQILSNPPIVNIVDQYGNVVSGATGTITLAAYTDAQCTVAATGAFAVATNPVSSLSGSASFPGVSYTKAEGLYLGASSPGLSSACSPVIHVSAAAPSRVVLGGPATEGRTVCSGPFTAMTQDSYGNSASSSSSMTVTTSGGSGSYYTDSECANAVSGSNLITIPAASSSQTFYLQDMTAEAFTITTSVSGLTSGTEAVNVIQSAWGWVSGTDTTTQSGVYGTQGLAAPTNLPGVRWGTSGWDDPSGKTIWLFGGLGNDSAGSYSELNDFWKYDIASGDWTWVGGSKTGYSRGTFGTEGTPSTSNVPSARFNSGSFADSSGGFWLIGGDGDDSSGTYAHLGDLWKFDSSSGTWTWVAGASAAGASSCTDLSGHPGVAANYGTLGVEAASNQPGGISGAAGWVDSSGNVWVFGGYGCDSANGFNYLNDLWEYDTATSRWVWQGGSNTYGASGTYGTEGTGSTSNIPGARFGSVSWVDSSGIFWLFGGDGIDSAGSSGELNDLWSFDPSTGIWTWVAGSDLVNPSGTYGTKGSYSAGNIPGGRDHAAARYDSIHQVVWLFGGNGVDSTGTTGRLNDLWKYDPTTQQWMWVSGPDTAAGASSYGTEGVFGASNVPGSRWGGTLWLDQYENVWIFGGNDGTHHFDDLWEYLP